MYVVIVENPVAHWIETSIKENKYSWAVRRAWQDYKHVPFEVVLEAEVAERLEYLNALKLKAPRH